MTCQWVWLWFFLSFKLYNSQFNTSANIGKAGQSGRRKWGEKYWQGSLFLLSWDQYWSLSQISRCLLKNLCLNYLVRVLCEGKASLTCLKVREQPWFRKKSVKESKPGAFASPPSTICDKISVQLQCSQTWQLSQWRRLQDSEGTRYLHSHISFFYLPQNNESFREDLCIGLSINWLIGIFLRSGSSQGNGRTTLPGSDSSQADKREKLMKEVPKLRSCLYREIFS